MKIAPIVVFISTVAVSTLAVPAELAKRSFNCNGPFLIAARGSGEVNSNPVCANATAPDPACEGVLHQVVSAIESNFSNWPGSDTGLNYPALVNNNMGNYPPSVQAGIKNLKSLIASYVGQCGKTSKIVLLGYSQGAQVVSSTLGGGESQAPLASNYTQYNLGAPLERPANTSPSVKAAAVFGDPTFLANQTYDGGNATTNGVIPGSGPTPQTLAPYKNVYRSYCTDGDKYCASGKGSNGLDIHHQEIQDWGSDAAKFVIFLLRAGGLH